MHEALGFDQTHTLDIHLSLFEISDILGICIFKFLTHLLKVFTLLKLTIGADPHSLSKEISPPSDKPAKHMSIKSVMPIYASHGQPACDQIHEARGEKALSRRHMQL